MKTCSMCKTEKELSKFYTQTQRGKTRPLAHCIDCNREKDKSPACRWSRGRAMNRRYGIAWDLTREEFTELISKPCSYCGGDLLDSTGICLDRLDSLKGYTRDNVIPCCWLCNFVRRNTFTSAEMYVLGPVLATIRATRIAKGEPLPRPPGKKSGKRIRPMKFPREKCYKNTEVE